MKTKYLQATLRTKDLPDGSPEGSVQAMFSVFNTVDQSREVVMPSFFVDGQEVAMSSWGHRWDNLPVGKGIIRVTPEGAVFDGQFFLNTTAGREHYETIKSMGDLQEWSFGFRVLDARPGEFDGQEVIFLLRGETFEVSPVLVGDNRETVTIDLKAFDPRSREERPQSVDPTDLVITGLNVHAKYVADLMVQAKEGRAISSARRNQLVDSVSSLRQVADTIDAILEETAPPKKEADVEDVQQKGQESGQAQESIQDDNSVDDQEGVDADAVLKDLLEMERMRSELLGVQLPA